MGLLQNFWTRMMTRKIRSRTSYSAQFHAWMASPRRSELSGPKFRKLVLYPTELRGSLSVLWTNLWSTCGAHFEWLILPAKLSARLCLRLWGTATRTVRPFLVSRARKELDNPLISFCLSAVSQIGAWRAVALCCGGYALASFFAKAEIPYF